MALILSTQPTSTARLAVGGLGWDALEGAVTFDATYGARCNSGGGTANARATKNVVSSIFTGSTYFTPFLFGSAEPIIRGDIDINTPLRLQISQRTTGKLSGVIFDATGQTTGADTNTALVSGTTYLIDWLFDASGTTWTITFRISDANGVIIEVPPIVSGNPGQTASVIDSLSVGWVGASSNPGDNAFLNTAGYDTNVYPIGYHTVNDTQETNSGTYRPDYVRNFNVASGQTLLGVNVPWTAPDSPTSVKLVAPYPPFYALAESSSKLNRKVYLWNTNYNNVVPPNQFYVIRELMNGNLLGSPRIPVISAMGNTNIGGDWPATGCVAFSNGSMDSTLQAWCNLLLTLPSGWPIIWRLWREMNLNGVSYGPNGSAHGGVNETPLSFSTGYNYVANFVRSRVPNCLFAWCPSAQQASPVGNLNQWDPSLVLNTSVQDINGVDAYVGATSFLNNVTPMWQAYNTVSGTVSRKPFIVFETQVADADANRITEIAQYTPDTIAHLPGITGVMLWDTINGTYQIADVPAGALAQFQTTFGASPFLGVPNTYRLMKDQNNHLRPRNYSGSI